MKIIAIVVTYNRLALLQKCINAINNQVRKPDEIIVVNNGSTDGTTEWLLSQPYTVFNQENKGGAAGFSFGIRKAYEKHADWIWLMDDDTIPSPHALQQLITPLNELKEHQNGIGFLSSNVQWTDGTSHKMNRTWPYRNEKIRSQFPFLKGTPYTLVKWGTFVSMLLSAKAVEKVGLPIKEFFIWCDDVEYSTRIIRSGMAGIAVPESMVIHETPVNHESNIFKDSSDNLWKYKFGLRNELYNKRVHGSTKDFWRAFARRMLVWPLHIIHKQKAQHWKFIKVVWTSSLQAISFNPSIEKVSRLSVRDMKPIDKKELTL